MWASVHGLPGAGNLRQDPVRRPLMRTPLMLLALVAHLLLAAAAPAQEWPSRPLTMVVPFAAGGGADLLGGILAPPLSELLGQPVTLEIVGGGGGEKGRLLGSRAALHGFTPFVG